MYLFLLLFATVAYLPCVVLFPRELPDGWGYREFFFARRRWFFGLWTVALLLDIPDTILKGQSHVDALGPEYVARQVVQIPLFVVAAFSSNERFHAILAVSTAAYQMSWILRLHWRCDTPPNKALQRTGYRVAAIPLW